jgi:hypothetical protein
MRDEIIHELWQIKDELAREANYDVHVLCRKLREQQAASRELVVDRSAGLVVAGAPTEAGAPSAVSASR